MSKIALNSNASGTGVFTIASPNSDTDRTLNLPDISGDVSVFPSGTAMLFAQTTAPTGWTKSTTHNDKALRVVSGTASFGGSVAFTTAFGSQSVGATTLSISEMPSHNHEQYLTNYTAGQVNTLARQPRQLAYQFSGTTQSTGGGGSHTHSLDLSVNYVDVIIATKD